MKMEFCSICGKSFIPAGQHMYKVRDARGHVTLQCSYACYRKAGGDPGQRYISMTGRKLK